jgi:poly[(R)-3-hydroxyalkanoate] polymerase subunit PhaC
MTATAAREGLPGPGAPRANKSGRRQAKAGAAVVSPSAPPPKSPDPAVPAAGPPQPWEGTDSYSTDRYSTLGIDRTFKANLARMTFGISPAGIVSKYFEWLAHLAVSPGKQLQLAEKAQRKTARLMHYAATQARDPGAPRCIEPLPQDHRFDHEAWQTWPYNVAQQSFLLMQQWWHNATNDVDGLLPKDEHAISFVTRRILVDRLDRVADGAHAGQSGSAAHGRRGQPARARRRARDLCS